MACLGLGPDSPVCGCGLCGMYGFLRILSKISLLNCLWSPEDAVTSQESSDIGFHLRVFHIGFNVLGGPVDFAKEVDDISIGHIAVFQSFTNHI